AGPVGGASCSETEKIKRHRPRRRTACKLLLQSIIVAVGRLLPFVERPEIDSMASCGPVLASCRAPPHRETIRGHLARGRLRLISECRRLILWTVRRSTAPR